MGKRACFAALVCAMAGWSGLALAAAAKPAPLAAAAVTSATTMTERQKIDFLIKTVAGSDLVFIRNGSEYNSKKAAGHLRDKLNYALKRVKPGQQVTARDFIKLIASGSSISKKPYLIRQKDGKEMPSGEWLTKRLEDLEKARQGAPAATPGPVKVKPETVRPVADKT